jgi:hypothetical protein
MRFLTCADSDADTAVGCGGDDGDEDDEELNGLRPPKDILGLDFGAGWDKIRNGCFLERSPVWFTRRIRVAWYVACSSGGNESPAYSREDEVCLILT